MQETPLQPIAYALQFRGRIKSLSSRVLEQRASAASQVLITTVDADGLAARVQPGEGEEALLISRLVLADDDSFDQSGTIEFAPGHTLAFRSIAAARLLFPPASSRACRSCRRRDARTSEATWPLSDSSGEAL